MRTALKKVGFQPSFGVTSTHWSIVLSYTQHKQIFLLLRGGKAAALPWIERRFPAKPLDLKIKVEPRTGLLWAHSNSDRSEVFGAGHLVLARGPLGFRAVNQKGTPGNAINYPDTEAWVAAGVVIDRASGHPFTSDYDLAAVIHRTEFDYTSDVVGFKLGKSRTSPLAEQVRSELNELFGSRRIPHGPQVMYDQKFSPDGAGGETILTFCPNGDVYAFATPDDEAESCMQYRDLLIAIHPGKRASFEN
ncbi:MAG: hypothetical protein ACKVX7_08750 [Planctomycetota bacterium]